METGTRVLERFLRYVRVDSASDPAIAACPSTGGQVVLADLLESELASMGGPWETARLSDGSLLVRVRPERGREGAVHAAILAHLDTYYGLPGKASPRVVDYSGGDLAIAEGLSIPARELAPFKDSRLVVAGGETLLGADDKAGVAALMETLERVAEGSVRHGAFEAWFTADEEIGRLGVEALPPGLGSSWDILWTLDGEALADLSVGDLAIRRAKLLFRGLDAHPCLHGHDLVPAHYAAARFVDRLAELPNPMTSGERQPFYQVASIEGRADRAEVFCRFASFDDGDLDGMEARLKELAADAARAYGTSVEFEVSTGSSNFRAAVAERPELVEPARRALAARGYEVREREIRGGTDGGLLAVSFPDLPAPDLGTGARRPHSLAEYLVVDELAALPDVVAELISAYAAMSPRTNRKL